MTEREYNNCVDQYADSVFRFILKNLRNEEDARDIVQSAFEKMWIKREAIINETAKSFLFKIAYNQMIDHIRKNKRIQLNDEFKEDAWVQKEHSSSLKRELEKALEILTQLQKSLILLKDYEGYSYAEIGEITGLNESQVKVYLHRARLHLRNFIGKSENII
jgi:RNA polymerase sigma-70 factor (ECF subfamily)